MISNPCYGVAGVCEAASERARFWGPVLGRQVAADATAENAVLLVGDEAISGPRLTFHRVPEAKAVKTPLHLDRISATFEAETKRLENLAARRRRAFQTTRPR